MNQQYHSPGKIKRHLKLWIYLLPVVGIIPALWSLYRPPNHTQTFPENREQQKVSRLAISLGLVWLSSYALFSLGAANGGEILSFRFLYANAILTTGYFLTCTILMSRLNRKSLSLEDEFPTRHSARSLEKKS